MEEESSGATPQRSVWYCSVSEGVFESDLQSGPLPLPDIRVFVSQEENHKMDVYHTKCRTSIMTPGHGISRT